MALLRMSGISKSFPGVQALSDVGFSVEAGEVHALMGENGAGKSTLLKILTGVTSLDAGAIELDGTSIRPRSPLEAARLGISAVYQELSLAPNLSIAENIVLGREPTGPWGIRWAEVRRRARHALERLGVSVDVDRPLGECSAAIQHLTAIARACDIKARLLILDEPTSSLDREEVERLFGVIRRLQEQGLGIVYVTHFLDEVYAIANRMTVLRNGAIVGCESTAAMPKHQLVELMIGRVIGNSVQPDRTAVSSGEPVLQLEACAHRRGVRGLTFDVHAGEVVGLAGLLGSGRTETLRLIFGLDSLDRGTLKCEGNTVRLTPRQAIRMGIGMSPEERKSEAIFPSLSILENMLMVTQVQRGWARRVGKEGLAQALEWSRELRIAAPSLDRPISNLSGGNQQKALLARWLIAKPKVLLLDEPTRGVDVGARFEITGWLSRLSQSGMALLLVSSELSEVAQSSTRVVVLRDLQMVADLADFDESTIMQHIAGGP